jgi:hypothetical protein
MMRVYTPEISEY